VSALVWVVLVVVLLAPAVVIALLRNEGRRARGRTAASRVHVDAAGVRRELADGRVEEVWWSEVREVEVLRANMGPHKDAGGVVLLGGPDERGALVPLDRVGLTGLLGHLANLDGFDRRAFDAAVGARAPSRTVVWQRGVSPP
jgi:hypothetical protein